VHEHYDLKAFSLFGLVFPEVHMHFDPFIGIAGLTLALLAIAACWADPRVRLLAFLGLGALVYSLGHNSVFQGLLYAITPDLDKARTPSAIVVLMQFAAAALAAFAIDHLRHDPPGPWLRRARQALLVFGSITLALCFFAILTNHLTFPADDRIVLTGFLALVLAAILLRPASAPIPLVFLLLFELGNFAQINLLDMSDHNRMQWLDKLHGNRDIADYLRQQPGFLRTDIANDLFAPNWGAWNGIEMRGGKLASVTYNVLDSDFFGLTAQRMWGVAYTIADKPGDRIGDEVFTASSGLKVYRRPDAFPRTWAVHELVPAASLGESNIQIFRDPESFHRKATILGAAPPPKLETCNGQDRVDLIEHLPGRLAIRADLACAGMVVLSDSYYPGWSARIDHRPTAIHQVNGAMRGVVVPPGSHTITMHYRPVSVYLGFALTALGILAALQLTMRFHSILGFWNLTGRQRDLPEPRR
jgi:hypothetical protein